MMHFTLKSEPIRHRIHASWSGVWTLADALAFSDAVNQDLTHLTRQPFALRLDATDWRPSQPEVVPLLIDILRRNVRHGLERLAVITPSGPAGQAVARLITSAGITDQAQAFSSLSVADSWLAARGY